MSIHIINVLAQANAGPGVADEAALFRMSGFQMNNRSRPEIPLTLEESSEASGGHGVDRVHDPGTGSFVVSVVDEFVD